MKVLFITQTFFPSYSGGTETYLLNVALELANRGISSLILCTNSNEKDGLYNYKGIPVQNVGKKLNLFKEVESIITTGNYDIVHVHTMGGKINDSFMQSLTYSGLPVFLTPHLAENFCLNGGKLKYKNKFDCNGRVDEIKCQTCISFLNKGLPFFFKNKFSQYILQHVIPDRIATRIFSQYHFLAKNVKKRILNLQHNNVHIIALSKWYEAVLKINNFKSVTLIPQGVNSLFIPRKKEQLKSNQYQWIFIGRLSPEKGIEELINVFIHNSLKKDKLLLCVFHNEELNDFEKLIFEKIKPFKNIYIYNNTKPEKLSNYLLQSDCLVLASKVREMAPLVIIEAIASGIPVLVSNFIGEDVEGQEVGYKFDYCNNNDFTSKFNKIRAATHKTNFPGLLNYSLSSFEKVAKHHIELYKSSLK